MPKPELKLDILQELADARDAHGAAQMLEMAGLLEKARLVIVDLLNLYLNDINTKGE